MKRIVYVVLLVAGFFAGGCSEGDKTETPGTAATASSAVAPHDMSPEQLGELGARVAAEPARAKELLSEHGMTEESFEAAVRRVTENVEESKRYAEAYRKAASN